MFWKFMFTVQDQSKYEKLTHIMQPCLISSTCRLVCLVCACACACLLFLLASWSESEVKSKSDDGVSVDNLESLIKIFFPFPTDFIFSDKFWYSSSLKEMQNGNFGMTRLLIKILEWFWAILQFRKISFSSIILRCDFSVTRSQKIVCESIFISQNFICFSCRMFFNIFGLQV